MRYSYRTGLAAIVLVTSGFPALAATVHTDEASFRAASSDPDKETFEGLLVGEAATNLATPGYSYEAFSGGGFPAGYNQGFAGTVQSGVMTLVNSNDALPGGDGPIVLVADTNMSFSAVGYWNTGGDDTTFLTVFDAAGTELMKQESAFGLEFLGFSGLVGATRVEISAATGNGWFSIDDLQVATSSIAPVPVPAALPLLLSALGFFGVMGWRRRQMGSVA